MQKVVAMSSARLAQRRDAMHETTLDARSPAGRRLAFPSFA
jgi:hypothetical protein